jgi:hypothetical protein
LMEPDSVFAALSPEKAALSDATSFLQFISCYNSKHFTKTTYGAKAAALRSAVYSVTPPGIFSFVELMYRMLSSESPTHTTSETALPKGAFVVLPVLVSRKYHVVVDLAVVQLYFCSENKA